MTILFYLLSLTSFFCIVAGVIYPEIFTFLFGKKPKRSYVASVYIVFSIAAAVFFIIYDISFLSSNQHSKFGEQTSSQDQSAATEIPTDTPSPTIYVAPTKSPIEQDKETMKDTVPPY